MVAPVLKLPRSYFKRKVPPPSVRMQNHTYVANLHANLTGRGVAGVDMRIKGKAALRNILLQNLATNLVNKTRAIHLNKTVEGWQELRAEGKLDEEVAIIVDGSPGRPMKNVAYGGNIRIMSPADPSLIIEAAKVAWLLLMKQTQGMITRGPGYDKKKPKGAPTYKKSFSLWVNETKPLDDVSALDKPGVITGDDFVTIYNAVPYAAKLERADGIYPNGPFLSTFKALRTKYGSRLAIRFDYIASDKYTMRQTGGTPVPQPVIRIGQPGAFPSGSAKTNLAKSRRRNKKEGKAY